MKFLNLVYPEKSWIKYKIIKFPDGQQNITLSIDHILLTRQESHHVQIKSRLNNFQDLELIICATKALRNSGITRIHLYTPYFLGSRSDRQFDENSNNYLKDVICPIINSLNFESVTILDPHSDVLEACLNNFRIVSNVGLFRESIRLIYGLAKARKDNPFILVSPDTGAIKKMYKLVQDVDYKDDIITCSKYRDNEGKLTECIVPWKIDGATKDLIIIDDICDGGQTFINIAKTARDEGYIGKYYLVVTHGIFSNRFSELEKYFDGIYCTNSYSDKEDWNFESGDPTSTRQLNFINNKVMQLNVF